MAKVYGVHTIALHPGVQAADFERFVREEIHMDTYAGQKMMVLRGDRGDRDGKFLVIVEFESETARDELFPPNAMPSDKMMQAWQPHMAKLEKWASMATPIQYTVGTDYVVLYETGSKPV